MQFYDRRTGMKKGGRQTTIVGTVAAVVGAIVAAGLMKETDGVTIVESVPVFVGAFAILSGVVAGAVEVVRNWLKVTRNPKNARWENFRGY